MRLTIRSLFDLNCSHLRISLRLNVHDFIGDDMLSINVGLMYLKRVVLKTIVK